MFIFYINSLQTVQIVYEVTKQKIPRFINVL